MALVRLAHRAASRARLWQSQWTPVREREVVAWTGITSAQWRRLAQRFSELPADPGPPAVRARRRLSGLAQRALASGRWTPRWEGPPPPRGPAVYVTAHVGSLLSLRYVLRARGVFAVSVIAPYNFDRPDPAAKDARFDRRFPMEYPHVVSSASAHRIRSLLARGSLILAADLPALAGVPTPLLGGEVELDPRPFRLARLAGVPCLPVFLTLPGRRWTLALGPPLAREDDRALEGFGRALARAASDAPLDLDGRVYWNRHRGAP